MSDNPFDPQDGPADLAPGDFGGEDGVTPGNIWPGVRGYLLGLGLAILLTVASFTTADTGLIWQPGIPVALAALAVAQIGVHLVFFLHINSAPDNTNNILALAFGVLIVMLVVGGSVWIMGHLNANMMPVGQIMQMQR